MSKILDLIKKEEQRQLETVSLIPSENFSYKKAREILSSSLSNKYSEGYPLKRYYEGNEYIDEIELEAIKQGKELFGVSSVNVQAYSGSPANSAVYFALLSPGDTVCGLSLSSGGHLTHGHPNITFSGKYFNSVQFGVDQFGFIDYDGLKEIIKVNKPRLLMVGGTSYPRNIDWKKIYSIASDSDIYLVADISHVSGFISSGYMESPIPYFDIIVTTTHKILRGPRGAAIMVTQKGIKKDPLLPKKIDKAVFPGLQGGPHNATTAAIAYTFKKDRSKKYFEYTKKVLENCQVLSKSLMDRGYSLVTQGTDNHLVLLDLTNKGVTGKEGSRALALAGIITNANSIPNDPRSPLNPSGIRMGTPSLTTRGMGESEITVLVDYIDKVLSDIENIKMIKSISKDVKRLTLNFTPID